ncbi:MAG: type II toxin-antitoxin system RelE/ParE family toxin [Verrucomicrobiota bacterium]
MSDEDYADMQLMLCERPDAGLLIPGTGGLRKLRWAVKGKGKRGGARMIYYWWRDKGQISLLLAYTKNEQEDLTREQIKILQKTMEEDL